MFLIVKDFIESIFSNSNLIGCVIFYLINFKEIFKVRLQIFYMNIILIILNCFIKNFLK